MTPLVEELSPAPDPVRCCERARGTAVPSVSRQRAHRDAGSAAIRFLTADPVAVVRSRGVEAECLDLRTGARREISGDRSSHSASSSAARGRAGAGLPPFQGGAAGYIAYDWG